jgi:phosphoglycerate dehydrogenase-like enzyme
MKPGSHLVNAARGPVVDEAALVEAVKAGRPARATLDVVAHEPPSPGDPVLNTPGIVVTPHVSYLSQESLDTLQIRAAENAIACLRGDHAAAAIVNRAELKL